MKTTSKISWALLCAAALSACREEKIIPPTDFKPSIKGVFVLNQGTMGQNNATLDYWNIDSQRYSLNIYPSINSDAVMDLGDVGNDLAIYGSKMYAVVNGSGKVEVMDAATARRIRQVDIPNCRYIAFDGGYAYVTSYASYEGGECPNSDCPGYVAKIDTASLTIVGRCKVGLQPDGIAIANGNIYVANSGGYHADWTTGEGYDSTLSVISLASFTETKKVAVGINPDRVAVDAGGAVWVSLRGNYGAVPPSIACYNNSGGVAKLAIPVSAFSIAGDSLFYYGTEYDASWNTIASYGIVNVVSRQKVSDGFITDGTSGDVATPSFILASRERGEIYLGDAGDYVLPGAVFCYGYDGKKKWNERAGVIPAAAAMR